MDKLIYRQVKITQEQDQRITTYMEEYGYTTFQQVMESLMFLVGIVDEIKSAYAANRKDNRFENPHVGRPRKKSDE